VDPDVINFGGVMVVILMSLAGLAFISRWVWREFSGHKRRDSLPTENFDERFAQLQQSVDAIAVEVERIAEGQRFSTKLLTDVNRNNVYSGER
jgi:hypothetical protein